MIAGLWITRQQNIERIIKVVETRLDNLFASPSQCYIYIALLALGLPTPLPFALVSTLYEQKKFVSVETLVYLQSCAVAHIFRYPEASSPMIHSYRASAEPAFPIHPLPPSIIPVTFRPEVRMNAKIISQTPNQTTYRNVRGEFNP